MTHSWNIKAFWGTPPPGRAVQAAIWLRVPPLGSMGWYHHQPRSELTLFDNLWPQDEDAGSPGPAQKHPTRSSLEACTSSPGPATLKRRVAREDSGKSCLRPRPHRDTRGEQITRRETALPAQTDSEPGRGRADATGPAQAQAPLNFRPAQSPTPLMRWTTTRLFFLPLLFLTTPSHPFTHIDDIVQKSPGR